MNLNDAPIRKKVTLLIMATSAVVLLLTTIAFLSYEVFASHRSVVQNSQTIAQITAAQSSAAVYFEDQRGCMEILSKLKAEQRVLLAALYAKDGNYWPATRRRAGPSLSPANPGPADMKSSRPGSTWSRL